MSNVSFGNTVFTFAAGETPALTMKEIHDLQELKEKDEKKKLKAREYNREYNKKYFSNPVNKERATNKRRELAAKKAEQKREQIVNERISNLQNDFNMKIEEMKILQDQLAKKNEENQDLLEENTMLQEENTNLQNCLNTIIQKKKDLERGITVTLACYA